MAADPKHRKREAMTRQNIYAFTEPSGSYPAYVSVNCEADGRLSITVRGPAVDGREGPTASMSLTEEQANTLADAIFDHTIAAEMRREATGGTDDR